MYLDTSIIISYVDEEDPRHADAEELIESISPRTYHNPLSP